MRLESILDKVGNTPLVSLHLEDFPSLNVFAKLEFFNPTGSVKDRAASYIIDKCLNRGIIDPNTVIIESSSGNFGVALSAYCRRRDLQFVCVIDPNISPINEMLIKSFGGQLDRVTTTDENGGYLLTRIKRVEELLKKHSNSYWINQYGNRLNAEAYYESLGGEICREFPENLDYLFLGVSSGGTIAGISRKLKEHFPAIKVIAVDIYGSVIFGNPPAKRFIPGIGSSMVPPILKDASIDEVVMISEADTIEHCHALLHEQSIFAGGSSGSVYAGIKKYFRNRTLPGKKANVACIFPDRGERYSNTIYDHAWAHEFIKSNGVKKEVPVTAYTV